MKKFLIYIIGIGCFLSPFRMLGQERLEISNETCRQMARESNKSLQVADNNRLNAEIEKQLAKSNFLPNVSGMAGAFYTPKEYAIQEGVNLSMKGVYLAGISVTQPIYTGGKIRAGYQSARIGAEMSQLNQQKETADVVADADEAYWLYVSVCQKVKLLEDYQRQMDELLQQTQVGVDVEMATRNDLLTIESEKSQIEYQLKRAQTGKELARLALCQKIGVPFDTEVVPTDTAIVVEQLCPDVLDTDFSSRPELKLLEKDIQLKEQHIKLSRADYLPSIGFSGGYTYYGGFKIGGVGNSDGIGTLMLSASIPIYHFGENYKKVKKAKVEATNSRLLFEHNKELMAIEVEQQKRSLLDAYQLIETAEKAFAQAKEALRITRLNYQEQMKTLVDLLDAQTRWQEAYSHLIEAQTNYKIQETAYLKSLGRLS